MIRRVIVRPVPAAVVVLAIRPLPDSNRCLNPREM